MPDLTIDSAIAQAEADIKRINAEATLIQEHMNEAGLSVAARERIVVALETTADDVIRAAHAQDCAEKEAAD